MDLLSDPFFNASTQSFLIIEISELSVYSARPVAPGDGTGVRDKKMPANLIPQHHELHR